MKASSLILLASLLAVSLTVIIGTILLSPIEDTDTPYKSSGYFLTVFNISREHSNGLHKNSTADEIRRLGCPIIPISDRDLASYPRLKKMIEGNITSDYSLPPEEGLRIGQEFNQKTLYYRGNYYVVYVGRFDAPPPSTQ